MFSARNVAVRLSQFIDHYLSAYDQWGRSRYSIPYPSRKSATQALADVAFRYVWLHYDGAQTTDGYELILEIRPLADAYEYAYRHELARTLLASAGAVHVKPSDWIVDVGGGYGLYLNELLERRVVLIDPGVRTNPWVLERPFVRKVAARGERLPIRDESAVLVSCFEVLEHLDDDIQRRRLLREIRRILKRDGILLFSTPKTDDWVGVAKLRVLKDASFSHHGVWTHRRIQKELERAGFKICRTSGTALDAKFINAFLFRHPKIIRPLHLLNMILELVPFGKRLKFQTVFWCTGPSVAAQRLRIGKGDRLIRQE